MNIALIVAIIGSLTSLIVAGIGFVAAVKAAKIASDRETKRVFAVRRHEAIVEAIKILQERATILRQIILVSDSKWGEAEVICQIQLILSLSQKIDQSLAANREMFGVVPYVPQCPVSNIDEQNDLSKVVSFVRVCKIVNAKMVARGTNMPTPEETLILKQGLEGIRETLEHDCDLAVKLVDYLCGQLNGGAT